MAVYYCHQCGDYKDGDWHPCEEHPTRDGELICPACMAEMPDTPEVRQMGQFTTSQLDIIKKAEADDE